MSKRLTLFLLIISLETVFAQSFDFKGYVEDVLKNRLPYANVIAKPKNVTKNMVFTITDEKGFYKLELEKKTEYTINITFMGFEPLSYIISSNEDKVKNFVLQEAKNKLEEVIIELPVSIKGDTTTYNTDKFINGKERKLKNVLKKLPGINVDKNGTIKVNGKKVTKMLVDGKPFFGGNSKLAIENIPADAIDKVQAIKNYNEVAFLKNVSDSEKLAMNIQLKEDKKRFVFGDVEIGKGNNNFYKTKGNLFYYAPVTTINFIGNSNNVGEKTFTFKDYLSFQGGVNAVFNDDFDWKGGDFSQFLESSDVLKREERFGALNISTTISPKLDLSGYTIFSYTNTNSLETNKNEYVNFLENQTNRETNKNKLGIGKITLDYTPNSKEQWYFKTQLKRVKADNFNEIISRVNNFENEIGTDAKSITHHINQNIEWHKKGDSRHTYSAIANYIFDKNINNSEWETNQPILEGLIPINKDQNIINVSQNKNIEKHNFTSVFKDFWVLNRNNHIYTTIGNSYEEQRFLTNDFQKLENEGVNDFSTNGFNNEVDYNFHDLYAALHYKFKTGVFTFKQGAYLHRYNWRVNQQNVRKTTKWNLLPDFLMKVEFNKSKDISFRYKMKTNFTDITKLTNRFYLQSYNSVFQGNENLENELYHSFNINYSRFSLYRGLIMQINAGYQKKVEGLRNTVEFDGVNRFLTIELLKNANENWNASVFVEKKIKKIKYKIGADYFSSKYIQKINSSLVNNKSNDYSLDVGLETLFDEFPYLDIGFRKNIGNYISSNTESTFTTDEPYANLEYDFLNAFKFNFDYRYYLYENKAQQLKNNYQLANASLLYQKEDSPWTFKLEAKNIFNTTFKRSNSFSDYLVSDTKTFILPRVVMLSISYKL